MLQQVPVTWMDCFEVHITQCMSNRRLLPHEGYCDDLATNTLPARCSTRGCEHHKPSCIAMESTYIYWQHRAVWLCAPLLHSVHIPAWLRVRVPTPEFAFQRVARDSDQSVLNLVLKPDCSHLLHRTRVSSQGPTGRCTWTRPKAPSWNARHDDAARLIARHATVAEAGLVNLLNKVLLASSAHSLHVW